MNLLTPLLLLTLGQPQATDSVAWRSDQLYIVVFTLGPSWDHSKQAHEQSGFSDHSKNLARLRKEKRALVGARYGAKGMIIFGASDSVDARNQFVGDPMVKEGRFNMELEKFVPFYGGTIPR